MEEKIIYLNVNIQQNNTYNINLNLEKNKEIWDNQQAQTDESWSAARPAHPWSR